jgi:hypothetical protein
MTKTAHLPAPPAPAVVVGANNPAHGTRALAGTPVILSTNVPRQLDPAGAAVADALLEQVRTAFQSALKAGVPTRVFLDMVSADARPQIVEEPLRDGYATAEEGLSVLLSAEGGCVDAAGARVRFRPPTGVSRQTISEKIRAGELIAYRTGGGTWALPVWQFRPQGGLLPGLPEVLAKIHDKLAHFGELFPFTFFLQSDPVTGGRTPLDALRAGESTAVLTALDSFVS